MSSVVRRTAMAKAGALLMLLGMALALAGCAGRRGGDIPYAPAAFNVQPDPLFAENREHRLGPTDLVTVSVYRAPELSGDYRVDAAGNIMMPLIGLRQVQGLTTTDLAAALSKELNGKYYVNPDVSVALKESSSQQITVDGSVNSPGVYPLPGRTTLMEAVALAKGVSGGANLRRVVVFRQIDGQRMAAAFDLEAIREAEMEDPLIYASDIIIVDGNKTNQTLRNVISTLPLVALFRPFLY